MSSIKFKLLTTAYTIKQLPSIAGLEIVMVGRSNVGKSSLINQLTKGGNKKSGLARVSQRPGCTQSINFYAYASQVNLVDLPGYGFVSSGANQRLKLAKLVEEYCAKRLAQVKAIIVHIVDIRLSLQKLDWQMLAWGKYFMYPYLLILNKCDKLSSSKFKQQQLLINEELAGSDWQPELIPISAKTGKGIKELKSKLNQKIIKLKGEKE